MKKLLVLATAAFLVSGIAFAKGDDKKDKGKKEACGKTCSKKNHKKEEKKQS